MGELTDHCPDCGTPMTSSAGGMCPKCLLTEDWTDTEPDLKVEASFSIEHLQTLFPALKIESLIAKGGMGAAYLVTQIGLNRKACLKVLSPSLSKNPEFVERFRQEAAAVGQLDHPNVVTVFDASQVEDVLYILMEYVDGANLKSYSQSHTMSPDQVIDFLCQVTSGLALAHENGIVHRDVKPANILVQADRAQAKISDFGLAKMDHTSVYGLTSVGTAMGTPRYMAPEQWDNTAAVDARSDVYAAGVVFYELATGKMPTGRFSLPSALTDGAYTTAFDQAICKALATNPDDRFQSADELHAAALELRHGRKRAPSKKMIAVAALVLIAVIGVIILGLDHFRNQDSILPIIATSPPVNDRGWLQIQTPRAEHFIGPKPMSSLGRSLAIVDDQIIAGAPEGGIKGLDITGSGYAMVRISQNDPGSERMEFDEVNPAFVIAGDADEGDLFGFEVAAGKRGSRQIAVIGAPGHPDEWGRNWANAGCAFIYAKDDDHKGWALLRKTVPEKESVTASVFGHAVAISDQHVVVGAPGFRETAQSDAGAVSVYRRIEDEQVKASWIVKPETTDRVFRNQKDVLDFGFCADVDDRFLIVGSPRHSDTENLEGAVFVYRLQSNGEWAFSERLSDKVPKAGEQFGYRVALHGEWLLVTSYSTRDGDESFPVGHVSVFKLEGDGESASWKFHQPLNVGREEISNRLELERFGYGIDVSDRFIAIGAPTTAQSGIKHHGIVFLYALDDSSGQWLPRTQILPRTGETRFGVSVKFGADFLAIGSIFFPATEANNKAGGVFCFDLKNFEDQ